MTDDVADVHVADVHVVRYAGHGGVGPRAHNLHPDVVLVVDLVVVATVIEQARD